MIEPWRGLSAAVRAWSASGSPIFLLSAAAVRRRRGGGKTRARAPWAMSAAAVLRSLAIEEGEAAEAIGRQQPAGLAEALLEGPLCACADHRERILEGLWLATCGLSTVHWGKRSRKSPVLKYASDFDGHRNLSARSVSASETPLHEKGVDS